MKYVFRHSEVYTIGMIYAQNSFDYAPEDKTICIRLGYGMEFTCVIMGIFFVPISSSKTRLELVQQELGASCRDTDEYWAEFFVDEVRFYLENGPEKFFEYTKKNEIKRQREEGERERRRTLGGAEAY